MIGIRELRADLAALVRRAGAGQEVVVSVGGRPVARLGPVGETLDPSVLPPRRSDPPRLGPPIAVWSGVRLDRALKELRG
jgi:prevent-host-death family protein